MSTKVRPATRELILRTTLAVIGRDGVSAVTNRRVASEAEVSLGSLTYHFPSQIDLLRESLLLYAGEEVDRLEVIAERLRSNAASAETVAVEVERIARDSSDRPELVAELELHLSASRDSRLQEASRSCFEAYEQVAAAALEALGVAEPARHAGTVVALISGTTLRRLGSGGKEPLSLADALLTLLRGTGSGT